MRGIQGYVGFFWHTRAAQRKPELTFIGTGV